MLPWSHLLSTPSTWAYQVAIRGQIPESSTYPGWKFTQEEELSENCKGTEIIKNLTDMVPRSKVVRKNLEMKKGWKEGWAYIYFV